MKNSQFRSKNQIVYELIRDAIVSGDFAPGSRIIIDDLAERFGISHSPIRECLRQLESDGFVTIRPYTGVTVTELQPELIMEVFSLLESLEVISSCRAYKRATSKQLDSLAHLIDEMEKYATAPQQWSAKNVEFHMSICDIADMTITKHMMNRALHHWDRLRRYYLLEVSAQRISQAQQEHHELLQAIRAGDEARIEHVILNHNQAALNDYLEHIKQTQQVDLFTALPYG